MGSQGSYYDRTAGSIEAPGETPAFATKQDLSNQSEVARLIEARWDCKVHSFGHWSPIDWWIERNGEVAALAELKSRSHESTKFDSVFLNVRKWIALQMGSVGLKAPSLYVVKFTDTVKWIDVCEVDASKMEIAW